MQARTLTIVEKCRRSPVGVAAPEDFRLADAGPADARDVLRDPALSLYCLDIPRRQALFVDTPPEEDPGAAPFLYQAQYEQARRVVRVPWEVMHKLAARVELDPARIVLVYSVGRCGSTLVSRAFAAAPGVASLSEPDAFTQLRDHWIEGDLRGRDKEKLLGACLRLQCVPGRLRGATAWAVKFRSNLVDLGELFHAVVPQAKVVFLYRNAVPWARSFLRFMRVTEPAQVAARYDWLAQRWLAAMDIALAMRRRGLPMFLARYEDLSAAPREVLGAMFDHCGIAGPAPDALDAVLAADSQAGSSISRESLGGQSAPALTAAQAQAFEAVLRRYSRSIAADQVIPGTFVPGAGSAP